LIRRIRLATGRSTNRMSKSAGSSWKNTIFECEEVVSVYPSKVPLTISAFEISEKGRKTGLFFRVLLRLLMLLDLFKTPS
jgi:hypothetical protein